MKIFRALCALLLTCALISSLTLPLHAAKVSDTPQLSAKSAILIDVSDKSVLYQKNARERMGMASTTKIMTALIIAEELPPDKKIAIPKAAVNTEGSSVYLTEGELLSVRELLCALLLSSANDAAVALAIASAGSIEAFSDKMNRKAKELGLTDTNFVNPHGLYDPAHYTTAYDLAIISAEALKNSAIKEIAGLKTAIIPQGVSATSPEGISKRYLYNHNKMLKLYDGTIGLKTGFTKKTGRCLVSAAERDGLCLIAVTLCAPDDWRDHTAMLDYGYSRYTRLTLFEKGEFTYQYAVTGGNEQYVTLVNSEALTLTLPKEYSQTLCTVTSAHRFEFAPIQAGKALAQVTVSAHGKSASSQLVALHSVDSIKKRR